MRQITTLSLLSLAALSAAFSFNFGRGQALTSQPPSDRANLQRNAGQIPMNPGPVRPPGSAHDDKADDIDNDSDLRISDILPKTRSINIFAGLTRDISSVSGRLDSMGDNTTLLAPLNSAMQELPRKPWEDRPGDADDGISAARNEEKAAQNLQRFVEEHIVPKSPWKPGKEHRVKTLGGQELWWEERGGKKVILPGEIVVSGVVGRVGNGEVWALKGVVNYA